MQAEHDMAYNMRLLQQHRRFFVLAGAAQALLYCFISISPHLPQLTDMYTNTHET